uniref:Splicing factor U2AF 26 kDa subunit n=1 Tax=Panagrellus redivivus TaxID=6233 RepID=A0A7E4UMF8_PANRE
MAGHGMSGAEYLASIYGTEKDKVNCSFYFKIGACRHGDKCSRTHNMPTFSQTILLKNLYHNPVIDMRQADAFSKVGQRNDQEQQYFDDFFEELFVEIDTKYGKIEEMNVCDNIGEHMIGNVYVKFYREEDAEKAKNALEDRWFNGEPIYAELSPVTDFREACCRQYELGGCQKGAFCNFMHLKPISRELKRKLYGNRARSPERYPRGRRGGGGGGGRDRDRDYGGRRDRDRDYDRRDRGDRYDDRRGGGDRRERRRSRDRDYR